MLSRTHRALTALERAEKILERIKEKGTRQVRYHLGKFLTYPFPARRGYGVHGDMVGVYRPNTPVEWIAADIEDVLSCK